MRTQAQYVLKQVTIAFIHVKANPPVTSTSQSKPTENVVKTNKQSAKTDNINPHKSTEFIKTEISVSIAQWQHLNAEVMSTLALLPSQGNLNIHPDN